MMICRFRAASTCGSGHRHGGEQRLGVGVQRVGVDVVARRDLDDLAEVHHRDAVGDVPHDGEVVRDEQVSEAELALQVLEQIDDLRLDGHIERGDGLVADDEGGVDGEGASDADALPLAAAELVGVARRHARVQPNEREDLRHPPPGLRLARREPVNAERLADDLPGGHARVERAVGVLEHHLHFFAEFAHPLAAHGGEFFAPEADGAGRGLVEPQDAASQRGLAATGLADEAERLSLADAEGNAVHRLHVADGLTQNDAGGDGEVHPQVGDFEDGLRRAVGRGGGGFAGGGGHAFAALAAAPSSPAMKQAARWPSTGSMSPGISVSHRSSA